MKKRGKGNWKIGGIARARIATVVISFLAFFSVYLIVYEMRFSETVKSLMCVAVIVVYSIVIMALMFEPKNKR